METQNFVETDTKSANFFQKLFNLYFSPHKTFSAIDTKPDWLLPLFFLAIITVIMAYITMPIFQEAIIQQVVDQQGISYEDAAKMIPAGFMKYAAIGGGFIGIWLTSFALSGFLYLVYGLILGGESTFKKTLSVYCYVALAIGFVGGILRTVLIIFTKKADIFFGPAAFLSLDKKNSVLFRLFSQLDFFIIWQLVLLIIGYSVIFKFSRGKSAIALISLWGLFVLGVVALGSLFQGGLAK
jgi:hypothetical protein